MLKRLKFLTSVPLFLLLAACGKEETAKLQCAPSPALASAFQQQWQREMVGIINQTSASDGRQYFDANKAAAAAASLTVNYTEPSAHPTQSVCQTELHIRVPDNVWQLARENAPLWGGAAPDEAVSHQLMGSMIRLENQEFVLPVHYIPPQNGQNNNFAYRDTNWTGAAKAVAAILLPAAVRDAINLNGAIVSRQQALQMLTAPQAAIASAAAPRKIQEVAAVDTAPLTPATASPSVAPAETPTEILKPDDAPKNAFHPDDLHEARRIHDNAVSEMQQAWQQIEPEIRQTLQDEQRRWEQRKEQNCRRAAAKAQSNAQSDYLYMQCDTRLMRERTPYLRGYSLPQ